MNAQKLKKFIAIVLSLPKSVYFNLRVFSFTVALKLPVMVHYHTKIKGIHKGCIKLDMTNIQIGMIQLGLVSGSDGVYYGEYPRFSGGGILI